MRTPVQNPNHLKQSRKIIGTVVLETSPHITSGKIRPQRAIQTTASRTAQTHTPTDLASRKNRNLAR